MTKKPEVSNVEQLEPHPFMPVDDAIEYLHRNKDKYKEVLVMGYSEDGDFFTVQSHMSRKDALWLLELARIDVMNY